MKISKKNKIIFSVTAIVLIVVIVALLVIPSDVVLERKEISYTSDTQKGIDFSNSFKEYISVGNTVLCIDEKTGAVAFLNKTTNDVYNSSSTDAAKSLLSATLNVVLCDEKGFEPRGGNFR